MKIFWCGSCRFLWAILLSFQLVCTGWAAEPVYLNTPEGAQRLDQSDLSRHYYQVAPYVDTQENMGFCGPASMAAVLNSLPGLSRPATNQYQPYRYFTQSGLFDAETSQIKTYEAVARSGLTLSETSRFLSKIHISNKVYYGNELTVDSLRSLLITTLANPKARIIVDFGRRVFAQSGDGHYSPLVAYNAQSDSVLIVDVAKFKYPPFWVTLPDLLKAIRTIDPDSKKFRGLVLVFEGQPGD